MLCRKSKLIERQVCRIKMMKKKNNGKKKNHIHKKTKQKGVTLALGQGSEWRLGTGPGRTKGT